MKLHLYEGGIRVPGIARLPGRIEPGGESREPVCGTDFLPTVVELAGIKPPAGLPLDGAGLVPLLRGEPLNRSTPLYWQYDKALGRKRFALRDGPWKLLADESLSGFELYNLEDDPGETRDLSGAQPDRVSQMAARMKKCFEDVDGTAPDPAPAR
jgi:arylsulfatase A